MEKERLNMWVMLVAEIKDSQARLTAWEEWGKRLRHAWDDDTTDLIDEVQLLLNEMPEEKAQDG